MLDWMTMDSGLRGWNHLAGSANPLYTAISSNKFYWTKGVNGFPWDIQLYDSHYIYLWITEFAWSDPHTYKKFSYNTNMPLAPRCARGGYPGSTITVPDTTYDIYTSCQHHTTHNLKKAVNQVYGPYSMSFGGNLPNNLPTLVVSYRYSCDNASNSTVAGSTGASMARPDSSSQRFTSTFTGIRVPSAATMTRTHGRYGSGA